MQDFGKLIRSGAFYVDKTSFIKEWWENQDDVTLVTRPRRFGKTLNLSMVDYFFSNQHADSGKLFENLDIWKEEKYQDLQGTFPVNPDISLPSRYPDSQTAFRNPHADWRKNNPPYLDLTSFQNVSGA